MRTTDRQLRTLAPTIEEMRWDIAEHEAMNLQTKDIIDYLYYGFEGLECKPDCEVTDEWNMLFGDANLREDYAPATKQAVEQTSNE